MVDRVFLNIQLDAVIRQDGPDWIATCPALDVVTQSETADMALSSLEHAVEGWFESCLDRNVLQQALSECGFERSGRTEINSISKPKGQHRTIQCSVPAYVLAVLDEAHAPR